MSLRLPSHAAPIALIILLLALALSDVGAQDRQPRTETGPITVPERDDGARSTRPDRVVMAYVETLRNTDVDAIDTLDYEAVTHVVHAFVRPELDATLTPVGNFTAYRPKLVEAVHKAGRKIIMSVGGAHDSEHFATIAAKHGLRLKLAQSIVTALTEWGYDGVDIDYEFPETDRQRDQFTLLMHAIHDAVKRANEDWLVMVGVSPGWFIDRYDFAALKHNTDYVFYFGYDWMNPACGPLTNPGKVQWISGGDKIEASCRGALDYMIEHGCPPEMIVMGLPFYSSKRRAWSDVRETWQARDEWAPHADWAEVNLVGAAGGDGDSDSDDDAEWMTTPECIPLKLAGVLDKDSSVLKDKATIGGIGWWEWGHEDPDEPDLSAAIRDWLAERK